jgi:hypothetical protein
MDSRLSQTGFTRGITLQLACVVDGREKSLRAAIG